MTDSAVRRALEVRRSAPERVQIVADSVGEQATIVLDVEAFALTANNVTYALFGDALGYWRFYPAATEGYGRVPVWGFARVVASDVDDIEVGSVWYGFLPMATSFGVTAGQVSAARFLAADAHRRDLPAAYNLYRRATPEHGFEPALRVHDMVFRPLFLTAYLIADMLDTRYPSLPAIVSSASSKTALALAADLRRRGTRRTIGLTSPGNAAFVESLGTYDSVAAYDDVDDLPAADSVFVDIAGRDTVRNAIHAYLGDHLRLSLAVGAAHGAVATTPPADGPRPELFFAPTVYNEQTAAVGIDTFEAAYQVAWTAFCRLAKDWLTERRLDGLEAAAEVWPKLVAGEVSPADALIVDLAASRTSPR